MRPVLALLIPVFVALLACLHTDARADSHGATQLPPVDVRCSADSDCATTQVVIEPGDGQCCVGCGTSTAGTKAWVAAVEATCPRILAEKHKTCAALRCVGGLLNAECKSGACVLKH